MSEADRASGDESAAAAAGPVLASFESRGGRFQVLSKFWTLWGFALFCLAVVLAFRAVVLPFLIAILVAYILAPVVEWLTAGRQLLGRPVPRAAGVLACYAVVLGLIVFFFTYFLPRLSGDFARLFREAPQLFHKINAEYVPRAGQLVDRYLGAGDEEGGAPRPHEEEPGPPHPRSEARITVVGENQWKIDLSGVELEVRPAGQGYIVAPRMVEPPEPGVGRWERGLKRWIAGLVHTSEGQMQRAVVLGQRVVRGTIQAVASLILVMMVAGFLLVDLARVRGFLRSLVPEAYRRDFDVVLTDIDSGLSGVIRGQLIICALNGMLTWFGLLLFHVKYPLLLAVVAAAMSVIPIFGSILSSVPIVTVALVSRTGGVSLWNGLGVLGWIILIHLTEANFFNPKILGSAARIHPVLVIFALLAGEQTYGLMGALLAVPVASIVQTLFVYVRRRVSRTAPA
jgi:predicted PurR-regulated permease PerM